MTPEIKCSACHRKAIPGKKYCVHHSQALDSLQNHYKAWVEAYGRISMEDFMDKLLEMKETGTWIREVIAAEKSSAKL
jgi:hypothetical protein